MLIAQGQKKIKEIQLTEKENQANLKHFIAIRNLEKEENLPLRNQLGIQADLERKKDIQLARLGLVKEEKEIQADIDQQNKIFTEELKKQNQERENTIKLLEKQFAQPQREGLEEMQLRMRYRRDPRALEAELEDFNFILIVFRSLISWPTSQLYRKFSLDLFCFLSLSLSLSSSGVFSSIIIY